MLAVVVETRVSGEVTTLAYFNLENLTGLRKKIETKDDSEK